MTKDELAVPSSTSVPTVGWGEQTHSSSFLPHVPKVVMLSKPFNKVDKITTTFCHFMLVET